MMPATSPAERLHVVMSLTASGGMFLASLLAYLLGTPFQFAQVSVVLASAMVLATPLQFGADHNLPRIARRDPKNLQAMFLAQIVVAGTLALLASMIGLAVVRVTALPSNLVWLALALSTATALQIVADSLLRARRKLLTLGALHGTIGLITALVVPALMFVSAYDAFAYVVVLIIVKTLFFVVVFFREILQVDTPIRAALSVPIQLPSGALISSSCIMLGTGDTLLLTNAIDGEAAASYVAVKFFAYGVFLAVVNEAILPSFIGRLVSGHVPNPRAYTIAVVTISTFATVLTAVLCQAIQWIRGSEHGSLALSLLLGLGIGVHTLAVLGIRVSFMITSLSPRSIRIATGLFLTTFIIAYAVISKVDLNEQAVRMTYIIWTTWNIAAFLLATIAIHRLRSGPVVAGVVPVRD